MNGIELAIRFSDITNKLSFCGPGSAQEAFVRFLKDGSNAEEVREIISKFEGLYPYLKAIGDKHGKDFLDDDVVEAYWIGNKLLDVFTDKDIIKIVEHLVQRGLPESIGKQIIDELPVGFVPHHNFNVFYVGVGRTTGSVEMTTQNMDNCRTSWGRVVEIKGTMLTVMTQTLERKEDKYVLSNEQPKSIVYLPERFPSLKKDDVVGIHWGSACVVLTEEQLEQLQKYTEKTIEIMNTLL